MNYMGLRPCFRFAVKTGAPGDLDQILIVRGAVKFGLCGNQLSRCALHGDCSFVVSRGYQF
jgi:hypothetical protein